MCKTRLIVLTFTTHIYIIALTKATINTFVLRLFVFVCVHKNNGGDLVFYNTFVDLCNKKGLSPSAAAEDMGYQRSVVTRWSKGTAPRQATLQRIANYFGVSVEELKGQKEKTATSGDGSSLDDTNYANLSDKNKVIVDQLIASLLESQSDD